MALDPLATIISQYASSPTLVRLVINMAEYVLPDANFEAFFAFIWNVDTAQGYGLDVWGRIVNVGRVVQVPGDEAFFGFEEGLPDSATFGEGVFFRGSGATSNYELTDAAYRTLILAKALSNITDGSIPAINQIMLNLFPERGNCYCTDGADMSMTYTFEFALTPVELAIVNQSGVLAKPAGVVASVVVIP